MPANGRKRDSASFWKSEQQPDRQTIKVRCLCEFVFVSVCVGLQGGLTGKERSHGGNPAAQPKASLDKEPSEGW